MKKLVLLLIVAFAFCPMAMASDIAISTQANWWSQAAADREMQEIVDNVTAVDVQRFTSSEQDALAEWVVAHTGDGSSDLLILCGQCPDTIYPPGNTQPDGSIIELFLDDGNCIINTGDWIFYVVNGAGTNGTAALPNIMDIPSMDMWDDDTPVTVTDEGHQYTPSLTDFSTDRAIHLDALTNDWSAELILALAADKNRAEPCILHNSVTDGRIGVFFQTASQDNDPRGEVISEWINNWYVKFVASANPYARHPDPKDGAVYTDTWVTLSWNAGDLAVSHNVYLGESFDDVNDGTGDTFIGNQTTAFLVAGFPGYPYPDGLMPGTTYYWRVDEVNDANPDSPWKGPVWSFSIPPRKAYDPSPADGTRYIDANPTLSWTPGHGAKLHTVYFGDSFEDVNNATQGLPVAITTYVPGALELDTIYYWRVDEFDGSATYKGNVWSFKTRPDIAIKDPNLLCWWKLDEGQGTIVLDWSGHGHHGTLIGDPQWVVGYDGGALDLDGSGDYVNFTSTSDLPAGASPRTMTGWGRTNSVASGWRWIAAYGSAGTDLATFIGMNGTDLYGGGYGDDVLLSGFWEVSVWHHISLTYDGTRAILYADGAQVASEAKSWNTTLGRAHIGRQVNDAAEFWNGQVDDVRIYNRVLSAEEIADVMRGDPLLAWGPSPTNGSTPDIDTATPLSWSAGDNASQHDVYFGMSKDAVTDADASDATGIYRGRQTAATYTPSEGVAWGGGPYYWRVDEVNTDGTISTGRIWTFSVADFILVDDFEGYTDDDAAGGAIWQHWIDGFGIADNGAQVGYLLPPYAEQTIIHSGNQSMPLLYDNTAGVANSEAVLSLTAPRDWTRHGLTDLSLWFRGYPGSVGSFTEAPAGTYTMTASGADIWDLGTAGDYHDEFHFAYKMLTGAGSIVARVNSVQNTNDWAKAGVMIRETLDEGSPHAFACITPSNGVAFQGRYTAGGASFNTNQTGITAPHWLRLERDVAGNFSMSHSADGTTWEPIASATPEMIPMSSTVYTGLALTSHDAAATCQAVFSNVTTTGNVSGQWANQDIGIASNAAEPLYVAIANSAGAPAVVAHDDPSAATIDTWTEWVIPLQAFVDQGINLANVDSIAIGLGAKAGTAGPGGTGTIYVDDIRLYPPSSD
jgi:hypothetical protein